MLPEARDDFGGFWIRAGAYVIDAIIVTAVLFPVKLGLVALFAFRSSLPIATLNVAINLILWWPYMAGLESSVWQATLGKKAAGLKVVDQNGNRISFGRASGRFLARYLSALTLLFGYFMVGWTKKRQGLHDLIAETFVIKVAASIPPVPPVLS